VDKKIFLHLGYNVTMVKFDKCLHFIQGFSARKHIVGVIIQYVSLKNIQKISLNLTRLKLRAVFGL
jgi:hypothetical protein